MKPPRVPWDHFPDVLIHANEPAVKQHPDYQAAKSGSDRAAVRLIRDTASSEQVQALATLVAGRTPTLVSAHAFEREGVNAIPEALADELGHRLDWPVDNNIVQSNIVSHTGADGFTRLALQPEFDGQVSPATEYVMVDDFVGMGGTLANLRGYIETNGGSVLAAVVLTGKPYSAKLRLTAERLHELRQRHGTALENWWRDRFAHTFDALTESEARYLARTPDADTIRNRIVAAEQAGNRATRD